MASQGLVAASGSGEEGNGSPVQLVGDDPRLDSSYSQLSGVWDRKGSGNIGNIPMGFHPDPFETLFGRA